MSNAPPRCVLSRRAQRTHDQPISYLMQQAVANPNLISLAAGLVDQESLPAQETLAAMHDLFANPECGRQALQYGTTPGHDRLRSLMLGHLEQLEGRSAAELALDIDNVVISAGSQQLLYLVTEALVDPGDIVLVSAPDYFVYFGVLDCMGAEVYGVAMDEQGMIPTALEETFHLLDQDGKLARVKLVYCVSYYQNPTGVSLAESRRPQVLETVQRWSTQGKIYLLEDAAYRELNYTGPAGRSIRSFDETGDTTILVQTFSKPFSPGMKTGVGFLPRALVAPLIQLKGAHDFGSPNFNQHLLATIVESGRYAAHVEMLRTRYCAKLQVMLKALDEQFAGLSVPVRWIVPEGGLYVWMILPQEIDTSRSGRLFQCCLEQGVLYVPGEYCFPATRLDPGVSALGVPRHTLRLSFGVQSAVGIREGLARLAQAVAHCVAT